MVHTSILKKCLEELSTGSPRLDYVRGMLETLIEMQPVERSSTVEPPIVNRLVAGSIPAAPADEASILDAQARASMDKLRGVKEGTVETV